MGLLDDVMGAVGGSGGSGKTMGALGNLVESAGGVQGIMSKLESSGLGDKLQSWIGTGQNEAISAEEVKRALGPDEVRKAADGAGMSEQETAQGLAGLLPELVDRASPDGKLPDVGKLDDMLAGFLKK